MVLYSIAILNIIEILDLVDIWKLEIGRPVDTTCDI